MLFFRKQPLSGTEKEMKGRLMKMKMLRKLASIGICVTLIGASALAETDAGISASEQPRNHCPRNKERYNRSKME